MALLTPALVGTPGAAVASVATIVTPTTLTPATGTGYAVGHTLLCFTACRAPTPTVATPTGWTSLLNVTGTNGRLALFAKVAASTTEAAPSVVWSGLTTGNSGTPVQARIAAFSGIAPITDTVGAVADGAASTATSAGGAAVTTLNDRALVLTLTTRLDDAFTTFTAPAGFTNITAAFGTTSGLDFAMGWAYQVKTPAGAVTAPNFGLTGATSFASSGVTLALRAGVSDVPADETSIDNFDRADGPVYAGAGASIWETFGGVTTAAGTIAAIASNRLAAGFTTNVYAQSKLQLAASFDLLFDVAVGNVGGLFCRFCIEAPNTTGVDAWTFSVSSAGVWELVSIQNGVSTTVLSDSSIGTLAAGSSVWIAKRGTVITVGYRRAGWVNFVQVLTIDDPRHDVAGPFFLQFFADTTVRLDNLRGGPLVISGPTYTDTGSGTTTASGTATESAAYTDAGTTIIVASGSGVETYQPPGTDYTDTATGALVTAGTSVETAARADATTGTATATGTGTEVYQPPAVNTDTQTGTATLLGTALETYATADTAAGAITAAGTSLDSSTYTDTGAAAITATGAGTDSWTLGYSDTNTGTTTASGAGSESAVYADTRTDGPAVTGTGSETYQPPAGGTVYTDATTGDISLAGSGVENSAAADTQTAAATATGTGLETHAHTGTGTGTTVASGTSTETHAETYTDTATGALTASGTGADHASTQDAQTANATATGTGQDNRHYTDTHQAGPALTGTSTETTTYTDAATGPITLAGTGTVTRHDDTATGAITATGTSVETYESLGFLGTGTIQFTGLGTDSTRYDDTATGAITATGAGISTHISHLPAGTPATLDPESAPVVPTVLPRRGNQPQHVRRPTHAQQTGTPTPRTTRRHPAPF